MILRDTYKGRQIYIGSEILRYPTYGDGDRVVKVLFATVSGSPERVEGGDADELVKAVKQRIDEGSI